VLRELMSSLNAFFEGAVDLRGQLFVGATLHFGVELASQVWHVRAAAYGRGELHNGSALLGAIRRNYRRPNVEISNCLAKSRARDLGSSASRNALLKGSCSMKSSRLLLFSSTFS
jgi:hypothetical protein